MKFTLEFYQTETGNIPVREFLNLLKNKEPKVHAIIVVALDKLRDSTNHGEPLTKPVGDKLFEVRYLGRVNTRILWFFVSGRRIILVHGIRHKAQKLSPQDKAVALERMQDWKRQNESKS